MPYTSIILAIALTLLGVFILLILYKEKKRFADYTLIFLNLICGLCLYVSLQATPEMPPLYFYLHLILPYLLFSTFMLYASQLITNKPWQRYYWLFFAFFIPMTLYFSYDIFLAHPDFKLVQKKYFYHPPFIYHVFFKSNKIYAIILCLGLLKELRTYTANLQNNFSYIEEIRFEWLTHYTIGLVLIYSFSLIAFLCYNIGLIESIENVYVVLNTLILVAYLYLSFHGVRHRGLETKPQELGMLHTKIAQQEPDIKTVQINQPKRYLKDDKSQEIYQKVLQVFDETQLFTQRQLKLSDLAEQVNVPPHQLSQIINSYYGKPFYDFVANYRVNLLKERLANPSNQQFTILSLGLDCGFNSKASLNRVFKEHTGLTPAQYRKTHLPR